MSKTHFNNIFLFIVASASSALAVAIFAYLIYLNRNNGPAMVFLIVFEFVLFSMFLTIMIWLIFFVKCLSFYRYNEQQIEQHFFGKKTIIKYSDIVLVAYNKKISMYGYKDLFHLYVDIKSSTSTITLRADLFLKEVRSLIFAKNSGCKEDEYVHKLVNYNND